MDHDRVNSIKKNLPYGSMYTSALYVKGISTSDLFKFLLNYCTFYNDFNNYF